MAAPEPARARRGADRERDALNQQFVDKVVNVVALYHHPPEKAVVLCVDEKSDMQALDRSQPVLPMMPGCPEWRSHDLVHSPLRALDGEGPHQRRTRAAGGGHRAQHQGTGLRRASAWTNSRDRHPGPADITERFCTILDCADIGFIPHGTPDWLPLPPDRSKSGWWRRVVRAERTGRTPPRSSGPLTGPELRCSSVTQRRKVKFVVVRKMSVMWLIPRQRITPWEGLRSGAHTELPEPERMRRRPARPGVATSPVGQTGEAGEPRRCPG
jgi:hypothetical protein